MMRAISLWQPYATGMALGLKTIETRNRLTHVRGELAIHASAKSFKPSEVPTYQQMIDSIPRGTQNIFCHQVIVAVVDIYDCWETEALLGPSRTISKVEELWGDYSAGRYGWTTRNLRALKEPVFCKGHQGFFFLPEDVEKKVRTQL